MKNKVKNKKAIGFVFLSVWFLSACTVPSMIVGSVSTAGVAAIRLSGFEKTLNDAQIKLDIVTEMLSRDDTLFLNVSIDSMAGRVLVTGTVPNEAAQKMLSEVAGAHEKVRGVFNEVVIGDKRSAAQAVRDGWLSTRLKTKLLLDGEISAVNFIIHVHRNVVYILGIALTQQEGQRVIDHARTLDGVADIKMIFETMSEMELAFQAAQELKKTDAQ